MNKFNLSTLCEKMKKLGNNARKKISAFAGDHKPLGYCMAILFFGTYKMIIVCETSDCIVPIHSSWCTTVSCMCTDSEWLSGDINNVIGVTYVFSD